MHNAQHKFISISIKIISAMAHYLSHYNIIIQQNEKYIKHFKQKFLSSLKNFSPFVTLLKNYHII